MVTPRTYSTLAAGFIVGSLCTIACSDSSRVIASILGDALSVSYDSSTSLLGASTVQDAIDATATRIGSLNALQTSAKGSVVDAVNEVQGEVGDVTALSTSAKTSIVAGVNEVNAKVGSLAALTTSVTTSAVLAINEVHANAGALSQLTTVTKTSLVAAINELKAAAGASPATYFVPIGQGIFGNQTGHSLGGGQLANAQADGECVLPRSGTIKSFQVTSRAATTAGASVTVSLLVNGTPVLAVTFIGGDTAQTKADAGTASVLAGDKITVRFQNTTATDSGTSFAATFDYQ